MKAVALKPCDDTLDMLIEAKAKPTHPLRVITPKESPMASVSSHAWTFTLFSAAIQELANELPNRVSVRQLLVFAMILENVSLGHSVTIADLREKAGSDKTGADLLGQSIGRSYQVFCKPTKKEPDNLGWVEVEENEDDRRQKFLRLTKEGEAVASKLARIFKEKP